MSLPEPNLDQNTEAQALAVEADKEERKRRRLLLLLLLMLLALCVVLYLAIRYLLQPAPIGDLMPVGVAQTINYPPTYKFSINNVSKPLGVGLSADGQRIYVAEGDGERAIKMFDRDGRLIQKFVPPGTTPANRQPTYIAVHPDGRVFVTDNYNHVIDVFDPGGNFIDAIIATNLTLTKVVAAQNNGTVPQGSLFFYNNIDKRVYFQLPDKDVQSVAVTRDAPWAPLGVKFDAEGNLLVTSVGAGADNILIIPAVALKDSWINYNPQIKQFGVSGKGDGQLYYPNSVTRNSKGDYFVSDGNNGRISHWSPDFAYKSFFGFGSSENDFNLPRGMWVDGKDRLHVADGVGQVIRVFDVSKSDPMYLFSFGDFGITDGMFNFPTDICIDSGGRLYIADRENNRIDIWSY